MNEACDKQRLRFSKTGRAIYISHLDLMRTMQRAFLRAELPIKYSEGFNPHAIMSFALPLSVGAASCCEIMDFRLREYVEPSEIAYRLNKTLPEGISIQEAYVWEQKPKNIKWLDVDGSFEYDDGSAAEKIPELCEFFQRESIVIERRTKSGMGQMDIAPAIRSIAFDQRDGCVISSCCISAQEPTLNPEHLISALRQLAPGLAPDFAAFTRTQIYDSEMNIFR